MAQSEIRERPSVIPWPPILLASVVVGSVVLGEIAPLAWPGLDDWPARVIGLTVGTLGVLIMAWAVLTLGRHRTTVMPHQGASKLVTSGPFRRFRNPIYLADVMILLGVAELTKNPWFAIGAFAFVPLVTWLAILPEERHLAAKFGEEYESYKARSRRWI